MHIGNGKFHKGTANNQSWIDLTDRFTDDQNNDKRFGKHSSIYTIAFPNPRCDIRNVLTLLCHATRIFHTFEHSSYYPDLVYAEMVGCHLVRCQRNNSTSNEWCLLCNSPAPWVAVVKPFTLRELRYSKSSISCCPLSKRPTLPNNCSSNGV
jgi:hypothetical protein